MINPLTEYGRREKFVDPDECYTPEIAILPLLPFMKDCKIIWDCAYGTGRLAEHFRKFGFDVIGDSSRDFFGNVYPLDSICDIICTNPPYSKKDKFLARAFEIGKPFALLLPLTTLGSLKRNKMFMDNEIQMIIPNRRINFEIPSKKSSAWFATAWFCYKMNLPKQLNFVEIDKNNG